MNYKGIKDKNYFCLNCNNKIPFKGYTFGHTYCDNKCQGQHQHRLNKEKYLKLFKRGKLKKRKWIHEILIELNGNKCSCCGITQWNKRPIRFWVDHIDENATNNNPDNFRLVCPNCDSQSSTFGAKNKGNGRKFWGLPAYG